MRNLPLLLALLLLSLLVAAASAHAAVVPVPTQVPALIALADEEEDEPEAEIAEDGDESEEAELDEGEPCEPEEGEPCGEEAQRKADECLLKSASATVIANPGKRRLRLAVHYKTLKPASVNVEASLRGPKGALFLGNEHTRLRRSGVYRDTFELPEKKMKKALAARDFEVKLQAVNTPPSCQVELTAHRDGAKKLLWS